MEDKKLNVHELAELYSVSVRTLQYYDEIGLLKPSRLDNGHRVYNGNEIDKLETIILLKELGMSLDEIKIYMTTNDIKSKKKLLNSRKRIYEEEIGEIKSKVKRLDCKIKELDTINKIEFDKVYVDMLPKYEHIPVNVIEKNGLKIILNVGTDIETEIDPENYSFISFNQFKEIPKEKIKKAYVYYMKDNRDPNLLFSSYKKQIADMNLKINSNVYCQNHIWVREGTILYMECEVIDA